MTAPPSIEPAVPSLPPCDEVGHCAGRRAVLRGAAALGAVGLLAACGGGGSDTAEPAAPPVGTDTGGSTTGGSGSSTPSASPTEAGSSSSGGTDLGPASEVPVGGGKTYEAQKVIVTQPTAGDYRAFTAVCTHTGCIIFQTSGGTMNCGCHGSKFSDKDGSVVQGPAQSPLAKKTVSLDGGTLKLT